MKRGVIFWVPKPPWWQHAKTRCVFQIYAIICISEKPTDFQNNDIQSPKYSVVLHLDHCIPVCVWGGGGLPIFLSPLFEVDHRTPLYTIDEGTPNIPFIEANKTLSQSMYLYFLF